MVRKKSTIHHARLTFDLAFALHSRDVLFPKLPGGHQRCSVPFYGWADSSPQGGKDWLLLHMHT
eukprot:4385260-Lingulodinium_polyedra.AAC.1